MEGRQRRGLRQGLRAEREPSAFSVYVALSVRVQTTLVPNWGPDSLKHQFVAAVLARYLWLSETPTQTSRHDRRLARSLYEGGVPLIAVEAGLLLGAARRALPRMSAVPVPSIRALHDFNPVITEVLNQGDPDVGYMAYLLARLRPLAELKLAWLRQRATYGDTG